MNWNRLEDTEDNKNYLNKLKLRTIYLADNAMSQHDDYFDMLKSRIPTLRQIDGNVLRPGAKLYHQKTPGAVVSAIKQEMNPQAKAMLESVLAQTSTTEETQPEKKE